MLSVFGDVCKWTTKAGDVWFVFVEQLETFLCIIQDRFELLVDLVDTRGRRLSFARRVRCLRQLGLSSGQDRFRGMTLDRQTRYARCDFSQTSLLTGGCVWL